MLQLLRKSKPCCIFVNSIGKGKDAIKINDFLYKICSLQNKLGSKFAVMQSLGRPRWSNTRWKELQKCNGVCQTAVHLESPPTRAMEVHCGFLPTQVPFGNPYSDGNLVRVLNLVSYGAVMLNYVRVEVP